MVGTPSLGGQSTASPDIRPSGRITRVIIRVRGPNPGQRASWWEARVWPPLPPPCHCSRTGAHAPPALRHARKNRMSSTTETSQPQVGNGDGASAVECRAEDRHHPDRVLVAVGERPVGGQVDGVALHRNQSRLDVPIGAELVPADSRATPRARLPCPCMSGTFGPATRAPRAVRLVASSFGGSTASDSAYRVRRGTSDTTPRATARGRSPRVL